MSIADETYAFLLRRILNNGSDRDDRTGVGTRAVFGHTMEFDLALGFPLLTTKKLHWKSIVAELLWMLSGSTNINDLDATIWDEWADEAGNLGPVYGHQLRNWTGIKTRIAAEHGLTYFERTPVVVDQLTTVIDGIKTDPFGRRHIISLWHPGDVPNMALPPCHGLVIQFFVTADGRLDCQMYQRSADAFLGVPFNVASYALLTMMVAQVTGYRPGRLIWVGGDCHLYSNHFEQARLQLTRKPYLAPTVVLDPSITNIEDFRPEHIRLTHYEAWPSIKAEVAV